MHPDVARAHGERASDMAMVNEAWEVLGNDIARHDYDRTIGVESPAPRRPVVANPEPPPGFGPAGGREYNPYWWSRRDPQREGFFWQMGLQALTHDFSGLDALGPRDIYRLVLRGCLVTGPQLQKLTRFVALEELSLADSSADDTFAPALSQIPNLRSLELNRCCITDAGLARIGDIKTLEDLSLFATKVTDSGMHSLAFHPRLAVLDLRETEVTEAGIPPLLTAPELHELRLPRAARRHERRINKLRPDIRVL